MGAIYKREMKAYFTSLITYFFFAAFFAVQGLFFQILYSNGASQVHLIPYDFPLYLTIFLLPLLTMRTISEDKRQKVDQVLLTAPVSVTSIVFAKFFACLTIFAISYSPIIIFEFIVAYHTTVNWAVFLYSFFGTMLFGATLIAIGVFISSLTESTAFAAVISIVVNIFLLAITSVAEIIGVEFFKKIISAIAVIDRYSSFADGILKISDIVYYLTFIAVFIFLTVRSIEKRRWA